jgi:hypothetical protein
VLGVLWHAARVTRMALLTVIAKRFISEFSIVLVRGA